MRWFFAKEGWPTSTLSIFAPQDEEVRTRVIDALQVRLPLSLTAFTMLAAVTPLTDTLCPRRPSERAGLMPPLSWYMQHTEHSRVPQDWKTDKYQDLVGSGAVKPRPGVLRLMDEARASGIKLAVCSAATKSSVIFTLTSLLGKERFEELDCFLAGDDVDKKKPDPAIYTLAAGARPASLPTS